MPAITDGFRAAFRDFAVSGVPSSGLHEPIKADIRALGGLIDGQLDALRQALAQGGLSLYATLADLEEEVGAPGDWALVIADPDPSVNGYYEWAENWQKRADFPSTTAIYQAIADEQAARIAGDEATNQRIDHLLPLMLFPRPASDFDDDFALPIVTLAGRVVFALRDNGSIFWPVDSSGEDVWLARPASDFGDDVEIAHVGTDGGIFYGKRDGGAWFFVGGIDGVGGGTAGLSEDVDPAVVKPGDDSRIVAYGIDGPREIDLGQLRAVAIYPAGPKYSAVLTRVISADTSPPETATTRYAIDRDFLIYVPDHPHLVEMVQRLGQSLGAGSNGVPVTTPDPLYPEEVEMPDVGPDSDVRLALTTSSGVAPVLDPQAIVGTRPMFSRPGVVSTGYGQTPTETLCFGLQRAIRERLGIRRRFVGFGTAVGGFAYSQIRKGTQVYTNGLLATERLRDIYQARGLTLRIPAMMLTHGESDMTSTTYAADLLEYWGDLNSDYLPLLGQAAQFPLVITQAIFANATLGIATRQMLQAHEANPGKIILAGPKYMLPYADDVRHLSGAGYHLLGDYEAKAWQAIKWGSAPYEPLRPTDIVRSGATIVIQHTGVVGALELDTTTVTERAGTVYGYEVKTLGGTKLTITDVALTGAQEVTLTLSSDPGQAVEVYYAMHGFDADPRDPAEMPRGNLRDQDSTPASYDGRPLYNWCVHYRKQAQEA